MNFDLSEAFQKLLEKLGGWMDAIILKLPNMVLAILILVVFYFLAKFISRVSRKYLLGKISQESIRAITARMIFALVFIIGFFLALGVMELDTVLTSILAGAGVVGLVIGLALQATLSNSVSGVMLSFLPRLRIGDFVETNGYIGFISEINLRSIVLRKPDNNFVIIPNSKILDEAFINYSLTERSRIAVECGVGYESDLPAVETLVKRIVGELYPQQQGEEVEFFYTEFGDSSINFTVRFWIDFTQNKQFLTAQHAVIKEIKKTFDAEGVNIPFPIRTLDFSKNAVRFDK